MSADIIIDDGTNPVVNGSVDRDNSFIGTAFTLSNFDDTNILAWRWTLKDKPIGSAASLTTPTLATTQITPDIPGGYLIQLDTYLDAGATDLDDSDVEEIGVRFEVPYDWLVPAAGETNQQDSARGWATSREESIRDVRLNLMATPTAVQTATVTATHGALVLYDPSGGTFTINAPASPSVGERWALKNVTVDTTSVTISGNGNSLEDPNTNTFLASYGLAVALISLDYLFDGTNWVLV